MKSSGGVTGSVWIGAVLLVAAGAVAITIGVLTPSGPAAFGWFAYQPLAHAAFVPGGQAMIVSHVAVAGWVVFGIGVASLAFLAGHVIGRRSQGDIGETTGGPR